LLFTAWAELSRWQMLGILLSAEMKTIFEKLKVIFENGQIRQQ
jgi:hypothetical protein